MTVFEFDVLDKLAKAKVPQAVYQMGASVKTLRGLGAKGYAQCVGGAMSNSTWKITDRGRAVLEKVLAS